MYYIQVATSSVLNGLFRVQEFPTTTLYVDLWPKLACVKLTLNKLVEA
jgi:hypothetical protein